MSRFLAARLHLQSLASETNLKALTAALRRPPTTLNDRYDEAMERIKEQPTKTLALRVLLWIVYAARPLRLKELQHAIAVDELEPDDRSISEESLTPPSILINACAGMVKIDEASNIIGLVHKTTQEYFDKNRPKFFPDGQSDIGTRCLKYLSLEVFSEGACSTEELYERRLSENVLLKYAAQNLGYHTHGMAEHTLNSLKLDFFLDEDKLECATQAFFVDTGEWYLGDEYGDEFPRSFCGVHYAAYCGLKDILRLLLVNHKVDPDTEDTWSRTPLSWAAENGHEAVVKLLLETDRVDINSGNVLNQTPLLWAAENGHEAVVKLLLETGRVDVEPRDYCNQTPLSCAAENGHEAVVKLLLKTGRVDVNLRDNGYKTPLLNAAKNGHEAVVKLLLKTGRVDINLRACGYITPLSQAAMNGHRAVVKLLLETGRVDVEPRDYTDQTPLAWAAKNGHEAVVKLLLKMGRVDINSKGGEYNQTPLSLAAERGHEAIVKLLLETGKADVNLNGGLSNRTPLSLAISNRHEAVVKLLLKIAEVDINSRDCFGRTPLWLALEWSCETVTIAGLETLKGDMNLKGGQYFQTPFSLVMVLLETGKVDVNLKGGQYDETPLSLAVKRGDEAVVKLLLETGEVDVNLKGGQYNQTPLELAVERKHEAVVKLLREKGAK